MAPKAALVLTADSQVVDKELELLASELEALVATEAAQLEANTVATYALYFGYTAPWMADNSLK